MKLAALGMCALVVGAIVTAALRSGDKSSPTLIGTGAVTTDVAQIGGCRSDDPEAALSPWVVGLGQQTAMRKLERAGLSAVVHGQGAHRVTIPPANPTSGIVIEQFPPRGVRACKSIPVVLIVRPP
jgi:hypothetical protein